MEVLEAEGDEELPYSFTWRRGLRLEMELDTPITVGCRGRSLPRRLCGELSRLCQAAPVLSPTLCLPDRSGKLNLGVLPRWLS